MLNREKVIKIDLMKLIILKVKKSSLPSSIFSFKNGHSNLVSTYEQKMDIKWILFMRYF